VGVFSFVIVSALLTRAELIAASLVLSVAMATTSGIPLRPLSKAYAAALPFIVLASLSVFLFAGTERGLEMLGRTSACVVALLVLAFGTGTFDLFAGMRRLRVPSVISTLLMLTYRYILVVSEEFSRMRTARRARGFRGGRSLLDRYALKILSFTAGTVLVRSTDRAELVYEGLKCRGFSGDITVWRTSVLGRNDLAFLAVLIMSSSALALAQTEVMRW
jgi:cobalt/nickel transport system permease protein